MGEGRKERGCTLREEANYDTGWKEMLLCNVNADDDMVFQCLSFGIKQEVFLPCAEGKMIIVMIPSKKAAGVCIQYV